MNIDSHFIIGKSHSICQDYAMNGISSLGKHYVMIADGLSNLRLVDGKVIPHPVSDVSARLVCLAAAKTINDIELAFGEALADIAHNFQLVFNLNLIKMSEDIGLDKFAMDATLRMVLANEISYLTLSIGDGLTITEMEDRYIYSYSTYEPNMPFNCSYLISEGRRNSYMQMKIVERVHDLICYKEEGKDSVETTMFLQDIKPIKIHIQPKTKVVSITVASDGLEQIARGNTYIPLKEAHKYIFPFKNMKGSFVKRRMNGLLLSLKKEELQNEDDLSIATIIF